MISPGVFTEWIIFRASSKTVRCWATLKGSPKGCPYGQAMKTVLGGFIFSEKCRTIDIPTVGIPTLSISLCINPTD